MSVRVARWAIAQMAVLLTVLVVVVAANSTRWIGTVFPGFFVMANRIIPSVALPDWMPIDPSRVFQHQLVAVDGVTMVDASAVYAYVRDLPPAKEVSYTFRRPNGTQTTETVQTRRFSGTDYALTFGASLFTTVAFVVSGLLVFWLKPASPAGVGFLNACLTVALFVITSVDLYQPYWFFRLHVLSECFLAPSLIHFALVFPTDRIRSHRRVVLSAAYLPFALLGAAYEIVLMSPAGYVLAHLLASASHGLASVAVIASAIYAWVGTRSPLMRRRIGLVALGASTGLVVPALAMGASGVLGGRVAINASAFTAFLFPLSVGYAIVKENLFEIDRMLRRVLTYAAMIAAVALACAGAFLLFNALVPGREELTRSSIVLVSLGLMGLFLAAPLRTRAQDAADYFFFRSDYDVEEALSVLSHALGGARTIEEVHARLQEVLAETVNPKEVRMFVRDPNGRFRERSGREERRGEITVPAELSARLVQGEALARYEWEGESDGSIAGFWRGLGTEILLPIRSAEGVIALLLLGPKGSARTYGMHDLDLLRAAAAQIGLALSSAIAFGQLEEEAQIDAALAHVAREMISSMDAPVLLDRLCAATAEVLGCDCSHTLLWNAEEGVYVPISGYGDTAEQLESIRLLKIPPAVVGELLARLDSDEVVVWHPDSSAPQDVLHAALKYTATTSISMALRRGAELVGVLTAGYRGHGRLLNGRHERIARGIARTASMALANAQLIEEVARASQIKSEFVASVSHELRTPLNHIIGYNDLMLEGAFGELGIEQQETLRRVQRSSRELLDLVEATLDLSRVEARRVPVEIGETSVTGLFAELEEETRGFLDESKVRLTWTADRSASCLHTDRVKLKMVLKNLIWNAIKFTEHGDISVQANAWGDGVEFMVRDTGIGIAPEDHAAVFQPFHRAGASPTLGRDGVGLGLYIVVRLVEALSGTISLESTVGQGSCFRIWLPRNPLAKPLSDDHSNAAQVNHPRSVPKVRPPRPEAPEDSTPAGPHLRLVSRR